MGVQLPATIDAIYTDWQNRREGLIRALTEGAWPWWLVWEPSSCTLDGQLPARRRA